MESAEVDTGFDRAPDAPPQDTEVLHDPYRVPAKIVLVLGDPVDHSPGRATPGVGLDRLRTAQKADEHRDQLLHAGEHAVIDTVLVVSTPACLPAGHNVGDVLVYAVRNAGGILHGPKYNRARRKAPAAKHRNATSRRGPCNYFASPYVYMCASRNGDE